MATQTTINTVVEFKAWVNSIQDSNLRKMVIFVYQQLCVTEGSKDVANVLMNSSISEIKITAFELGFQG